MSDITANAPITSGSPHRAAPITAAGPVAWLRENLFSGWLSTAVTLVLGYLIIRAVMGFVDWAFINAIWSVPVNANGVAQTQACRELHGTGACWAVVTEKHRFMLFGTYPYEQHWRPALVCLLFIGLYIVSALRSFWNWRLIPIWIVTLTAIGVLM